MRAWLMQNHSCLAKKSYYFNVKCEASTGRVMGCEKTYGEGQSAAPYTLHLAGSCPVWQLRILWQLGFLTIYSQFKTSYSTGEKKVTGKRRQEWCCAIAEGTLCTWAEVWKEGAAKMGIKNGQIRDFMEKHCIGHYLSMDFLCVFHANLCESCMFFVWTNRFVFI